MFQYQRENRYLAQIADTMEELGADELRELGASDATPIYRGVWFHADSATLYRANYCSRLLSKILAPLHSFKCTSTDELYDETSKIDWSLFLTPERTLAVFANVANSRITHSKYAALRVKDAIVDQFRDRTGRRPNVDTESPDLWIHVFVHGSSATLSVETSGGSLHRRGYRGPTVAAPMHETVAAAIIRLTEWDGERPLYDPMCGSGTLLCEALMKYTRTPAAFLRAKFGFERLPNFDPRVWERVKREADSAMREPAHGLIAGSDSSVKAIRAAGENTRNLPFGRTIDLHTSAFEKLDSLENCVIVTNPPAGIRIGAEEGIDVFIKSFGDFLKQRCKGSVAFVYLNDRSLVKHIGLRTAWKKPLKNAGLDGRLIKIELY